MRIVLIPNKLAISHACWPPAPPKLANLFIVGGSGQRRKQRNSKRAERNGEKFPDEIAFDSKCITPGESPRYLLALLLILTSIFAGTSFMARLSEQMRYFINKKI